MSIDVRGVNTHNKGAHLMLIAIVNQISKRWPITVSPNGSDYDDRARLGLRQSLILDQAPRMTAAVGSLLPRRMTAMFGVERASDISGVLDASGFAYSDSFGPKRSQREASLLRSWRRQQVPRVFLPQAFGTFSDQRVREFSRELLRDARVVYARDKVSLRYLQDSDMDSGNIRLCPDFTTLENGKVPTDLPSVPFAAFVPNSKMITHGDISQSQYIADARELLRYLDKRGMRPIVAPHESTDIPLARQIVDGTSGLVYWNNDPLAIKGFLSEAEITVGSRFHALVGSLSSGRPTVGIGWSHKYRELFSDYGVEHWIASDLGQAQTLVEASLDDAQGIKDVQYQGAVLKDKVSEMWHDVSSILEGR
ncbi:MAG: polysaccharide pyruvyl transferase family protein [Rhodococcus sp. (in: high G+C Gram-positive bacteria)]